MCVALIVFFVLAPVGLVGSSCNTLSLVKFCGDVFLSFVVYIYIIIFTSLFMFRTPRLFRKKFVESVMNHSGSLDA